VRFGLGRDRRSRLLRPRWRLQRRSTRPRANVAIQLGLGPRPSTSTGLGPRLHRAATSTSTGRDLRPDRAATSTATSTSTAAGSPRGGVDAPMRPLVGAGSLSARDDSTMRSSREGGPRPRSPGFAESSKMTTGRSLVAAIPSEGRRCLPRRGTARLPRDEVRKYKAARVLRSSERERADPKDRRKSVRHSAAGGPPFAFERAFDRHIRLRRGACPFSRRGPRSRTTAVGDLDGQKARGVMAPCKTRAFFGADESAPRRECSPATKRKSVRLGGASDVAERMSWAQPDQSRAEWPSFRQIVARAHPSLH